jgi:hypothetical protein
MSNAVVIGRLRGVEAGAIVLDGELRIIVPPTLSVADFPIGCNRVVIPVPHRHLHQLAMRTVLRPERPDRVRQLREAVHALLAVEDLEGVGAIPLELLAVQGGHFSSLPIGTFSAFASFSSVVIVGSWRPVSSRARYP